MTEQEKREKAIEELHSILLSDCRRYGNHVCPRNTCSECASARIYDNYIIRKEEEVRKETLQDLFTALQTHGQLFDYSGDDNAGFWAIDLDEVKDVIKQKFGVEVE